MKKFGILLLIMSFLGISCSDNTESYENPIPLPGDKEVEFRVVYRNPATRATVDYPSANGTNEEKKILTIDIIAFDATSKVFVYNREAYPTEGMTFRASVPAEHTLVDVAILANCPANVLSEVLNSTQWTASARKWEDLQQLLIDANPARLVNSDSFQPLPMCSDLLTNKEVLPTGISDWGTAPLMRAVASIDLLMIRSEATSKLELRKVHAYYAPNKGFLTAIASTATNPQQYNTPADMVTSLHSLTATRVGETQKSTAEEVMTYDAVTSQLYLYDNPTITFTPGAQRNATRVIVEGYYDQAEATGIKIPTFYPVYIHNGEDYRPMIRNWKYVMIVDAVYGAGYSTIEEAAVSSPINLNVQVIDWNIADVEIGVSGIFYVSLNKKQTTLLRKAGSTDGIVIGYVGEASDEFAFNFKDDTNGVQSPITNGIENDRFKVTFLSAAGSAMMIIESKGDYSTIDTENKDTVVLRYRNLEFEIPITQINSHPEDWIDGGDIPIDL